MSLTGIWTSQTRKQNGHYQSVKRGTEYPSFYYVFHSEGVYAPTLNYSNLRNLDLSFYPFAPGQTKPFIYSPDLPQNTSFYQKNYGINNINVGIIFREDFNTNLDNSGSAETAGIKLLGFEPSDTRTNGLFYKGEKTAEKMYVFLNNTEEESFHYEWMNNTTNNPNDTIQRILEPNTFNSGNYYRNFYSHGADNILSTYGRSRDYIKILEKPLRSLTYYGATRYRYFNIECNNDVTAQIFNQSGTNSFGRLLIQYVGTVLKEKTGITEFNFDFFISKGYYPVDFYLSDPTTPYFDTTPNPNDIILRYQ